ncbi:hypothetical protein POTOM_042985 [Populus tomentosa]|uniref:Elongin-A n=1 Tax=Populus tomentosa TaxID=118781 RepID=A0A8X8CFE1_POPTO|nr:hypothetical protein POTOM_042985 [Populus tomentosa]
MRDQRKKKGMLRTKRKVPSLVDLCVSLAVENVKYLGDVGETDLHLLDRILPHCTLDQLMHIEKSTVGRDLSSVTDKLWKTFYEKQFGERSTDLVIQRMRQKKVSFRWLQLYEAKLKEIAEAENKLAARIRQLYKKEDDRHSGPPSLCSNLKAPNIPSSLLKVTLADADTSRKQSRQVRLCSKVPPSSNKRSFCGGSGPGYNLSNGKSNLMKKAKMDFLKSREVQNIAAMKKNALQRNSMQNIAAMKKNALQRNSMQNVAAMKKNALQRNSSSSSMMKPPGSFPGKSSASSNPMKPLASRL